MAHLRRWPAAALGVALALPLCAQQAPAPSPDAAPPATAAHPQADTKPKRSTAEDNPFPEDVSKQAAAAAAADEKADRQAAASGSVAGADDDSSSSRDKLKDLDLLGDHDSRISNGAGGVVVNTKLSEDDLRVGTFYMQTGNYQGAYDRLKEAVAVNPDNPEAVFRLGEAARKLNKKDEALANFEVYLSALPDGPRAKSIRKAISEMAAKN